MTRASNVITEAQAREAWGRIKNGEASVGEESRKLSYRHNAPLRRAISALPEVGRELYLSTVAVRRYDRKKNKSPITSGTES